MLSVMSVVQLILAVLSVLMFISLLALLACFSKDFLTWFSRRIGTSNPKLRDLEINSAENKAQNERKLRELERTIRGMDVDGSRFRTLSPARARAPTMPQGRYYKRDPQLPLPTGTYAKWFIGARQRERSLRTDLLRRRHIMRNGGAELPPDPIPGARYSDGLAQNTLAYHEIQRYAARPMGPRPMITSTPATQSATDPPIVTLREPQPLLSPEAMANAIFALQEQCDDTNASVSSDTFTTEDDDAYIPISDTVNETIEVVNKSEYESGPILDVSSLLVPSDSWWSQASNELKEVASDSGSDSVSMHSDNSDKLSVASLPLPVVSPSSSPKKSVLKRASSSFKDFKGLTAAAAKSVAQTPRKVLKQVHNLARVSPKKASAVLKADKENMV